MTKPEKMLRENLTVKIIAILSSSPEREREIKRQLEQQTDQTMIDSTSDDQTQVEGNRTIEARRTEQEKGKQIS